MIRRRRRRARPSSRSIRSRSRGMSRSRPSKSLRRRLGFQTDIADDIPVPDDGDAAVDREIDAEWGSF